MTDRGFHTGPPAFTSLLPDAPVEHGVGVELAQRIEAYCGCRGTAASLGKPGPTIEGRYVLRCADREPLFLKIFDERILDLQRHSDRVAAHLAAQEVPVVLPVPGEPRPFGDGFYGEIFPLLDARFSRCDATELRRIGAVLGQLHRALQSFDVEPTRRAAVEMHQRLLSVADAVLGGWTPNAEFAAELRDAARGYRSAPLAIHQGPQMIHGDCNYTNILFDGVGGLRVIDFEESRAAWLNPMFDLAKVIERFVLVPAPPDARAIALAAIEAYPGAGGAAASVDFKQILIESNDRALMILADKHREGLRLPAAEWRKFVELKTLVERQASLLAELSASMSDLH
jgi:aminoglycoside phosphotransferase (APT) family kinase protein